MTQNQVQVTHKKKKKSALESNKIPIKALLLLLFIPWYLCDTPAPLPSLRQRQLEELQVLALQFHEALEPLGEWLSATERRLSSAEPMGTQTAKITQQIIKHKVRVWPHC